MINQIQQLALKANKAERLIIGLMSGTSLDGLDIALCSFVGAGISTQIKVLHFITIPYEVDFKQQIKKVFAKRQVDLQQVCLLNESIGISHAEMVLQALKKWNIMPTAVDFIASHGQTIFHSPKWMHQLPNYPNGTLQIGDGDHLSVNSGIITLSDFRQKHLAVGGEGAPLAVYGDYLIFSKRGENRIMLNIGGISNFTFLPEDLDAAKVFSTDVGPGNTLMDQYVQQHFKDIQFDKGAILALQGKVNMNLLSALLDNDFLQAPFPKTTGPELFNLTYLKLAQEKSATTTISHHDVLATLCHFTAQAITKAIHAISKKGQPKVFMSGGGMHNPLLVKLLKEALPDTVFSTTAELGIEPDAKEAVLFAVLANETIAGQPINFGNHEKTPSVCMGKISLPY